MDRTHKKNTSKVMKRWGLIREDNGLWECRHCDWASGFFISSIWRQTAIYVLKNVNDLSQNNGNTQFIRCYYGTIKRVIHFENMFYAFSVYSTLDSIHENATQYEPLQARTHMLNIRTQSFLFSSFRIQIQCRNQSISMDSKMTVCVVEHLNGTFEHFKCD